MKNIIKFLIGLIVFSNLVLARGENPPPPEMITKLKLSAQQQEQMKSLHKKQRIEFKKSMDKVKSLHDQLDQELLQENPSQTKVNNIIEQIKVIQTNLMDNHFEQILATRKILTRQQFKTMLDLRRDFSTKMEKRIRHKKNLSQGKDGKKRENVPPPHFLL